MNQYLSPTHISKIPFYFLFLLFSINIFSQQDYYWVGGNGNWSNYSSHWATSSGGNIFHTTSPGSNDKVIFDSNSFSQANQTVNLDSDNQSFKDMSWVGVTDNPKFNMSGKTFEVHGKVEYDPNMQFQSVGTLSFVSSSTGSIISGGHNLGNIYIRKPSGTFHLLSPIRTSNFTVENGSTFHTNDYNMRSSYIYFNGGTTTTTIYTGTSELLVEGGSIRVHYQSNSSSLKYLEANIVSSTIILDNAELVGRYIHHPKLNDINFGHVISRRSANRQFGEGVDRVRKFEIQKGTSHENYWQYIHNYFEGIIDTLDIESKKVKFNTSSNRNPKIGVFNVKGDGVTLEISHGSTITVSNSLSFESSSCSVVNIKSNSAGNQATINYVSGVTTATNLSIRDISFTGSGTITALNSVDGGNNTGIIISEDAPRNMYWIGGTGNWSDPAHWSTSDGGSGNVCAPTPNDNVFFTSNSFSAANQEITLNVDNIGIVNMDWTGVTNNPKLNMGGKIMEITGSVTYTADMTFQSAGTLSFLSADTTSIYTGEVNTNSARNLGNIYIRKPSGTFHLLSPIRTSNFTVENGSTFHTNDYNMRSSYIYFNGGTTTTTIYTGTSELLVEGGSIRVHYQSNSSSLKYLEANIVSSTIILDNAELVGRYIHHPKLNDINFGHVISRRSANRQFGEGVDRVRKFEIQKGTSHENYWQYIHNYFEGIIDTLDIESKKVKFNTSSNRNPKIGVFNVKGDGATLEISHGSTITVSNTLNFGSKSGTRNYIKSNSSGSIATINYHGNDVCADYLRVKDITLVSSSTIALGPYSQNEGNTSGFDFNTDTSNTISGISISVSPTGLSYYENQQISFVISSTYSNNNSATFHFFVNSQKTQSSTSTTFSGNNLKNGDKVFGSVEIPYTGTVTGCNFTTIGKTDEITLSLNLYPVITSSTYSQTNNKVAVTFNEPVFTANSGSGNLIPSDFEFSLTGGTGVLNSNQPTSVSKSGNTYTLGLNISNQAGSEVLTIKPKYNQIFDKDGRRSDQNQSNNSVRLGTVSASLLSAAVSSDNLTVMVTFSENVFSTVNGSGALEPSDFILEMSGGTATLSSTTPISIFSDNFKYSLGFIFGGVPNGNEVINVKLADNSIFDIQGVVLPQIQTNSSSNLKADADADGIANPVDLCPNTANGTAVNMNGCADSASKYFWVGGSGNWSDFSNHWATTSGGNVFHSRSPNGNDNVYFDRFSFTASGQTITADSDSSSLKNMSWTGVTNNPTFNFNGKSINVFGSVIFAENMTISSANLNFSGTTTSTLDSKGNFLNYVYVRGSDLSLAGPLKTYYTRAYSGSFRTNNHELTTRYFNVTQSSNTSLTMDLGTSSITIEYEMEWTQFYPGNYTTNVSSATIILGGRTFYDFGDSQWGEIRVVENPQWNGSTRYINTYNNNYSPSNNRYHPSIKKIDATQTLDKINLEVRNADEVEISASSDINNLSAKVLKLKGNGSIYRFGGTINVSNTLEIGVDGGCAITTFKSTSDGNTATINSAASTVASYLEVKDINFTSSNSSTLTANNSVDNGNNSGFTINTVSERDFYWVGGTGNWSDGNEWSFSSGGSVAGCPPSSGDDIYFDSNSFTGSGQSVTIDIDNAGLKNMSWTGVTNNPTFNFNGKSINVFGSVIFAENMTISSANLNFSGTTTSTLDSKGNFLNYVYVRGSDLSLAGPLKTYYTRAYSGSFRTNNHELTTRYFNVTQSSNTSLTMDLGTSSITIEYEMEWTQFYPGNYTTNVSSATIILGGRTFYDFGDSQWGEIRVVENPQWNGSTRYINTYNNNYSPSNNRYHPSIKKIDATQTLDKINLEVRNADEVEISASSDINNLSAKVLKLKGNGSIYRFGGTINVSNTLDLTSNLGVVNTLTSTSNGNRSTLNYDGPFCIDYAAIRDIVFSNSVTVTAGPNSVDNGNNVGIEFFTDNNITIQSFTITSSMGTSIADFEQSSFTASSTTGFDPNMTLNWYVNNQLKQSGTSTTFSPGLITENYTIECATELPYTGGQTGSCAFIVKAKSNTINMTVSRNPIIKETKLTADNQFIKVRFSKPVFTNSNGTGDLITSDFRLYLSGGNATLSSSYPTSVVKEGEFYKLTFGLNGKYNGQEQITVKPHGDSNIYDSGGLRAYQNTQTNNVVTLNYNPPIIDGVSVNSTLNELTIIFSEPVNGSDESPYNTPLKYNVLHLSVSGGAATLNTPLPNSISGSLDTYKVGFTLSGTPNGSEIFQVTPVYNSIFDMQGFPASHLQDYNTTCTNCDTDNDGVIDARDLCPNTVSGTTVDQNGCSKDQKDTDYDGVPDYLDFCLNTTLGTEVNSNGCAETQTNQQSPITQVNNTSNQNESTPEPFKVNPADLDGDGYSNGVDAFPNDPFEHLDTDGDGIGDNADNDDDNDGFTDKQESLCKTNPKDSNSSPTDNDGDKILDCVDTDDDNDGVKDKDDVFPLDDSEYIDTDKDEIGNNADEDDDGDGFKDAYEIECETDPLNRYSKPRDYDRDLIPDCIDTDDDDDGCLDQEDLFPFNERECKDADGDGIGDKSDMDADNDGIIDEFDDFPTDPNESKDTDGDGIGDNADQDDNNDGFPEEPVINSAGEEVVPIFVSELLTPNQSGEEAKWRIVNIDKYPTANVKIYTSTGIIVYESWGYKNDWDGKGKNGKSLPTGPYMYMIDRGDETQVEEGWLYIFN